MGNTHGTPLSVPNAARIDVDSAVTVGDHSVGRPAAPELARDDDELLGALVAVGVVEEAAATEVLAGERVRRGDHVPACAAVGQVVEGGELPCHFKWFVERGIDGACQPQSVGDAGERGEDGEGVGAADHVKVVDAATVLPQPQALGEEEEVEKAALRRLREVRERVELDLAARLRIRPHRGVVDTREVRGQMNGFAVLALSHPLNPHAFAISSCERSRSA